MVEQVFISHDDRQTVKVRRRERNPKSNDEKKSLQPITKVCAGIADEVAMYLPPKLIKSAFTGWPYDPIVTGLDADAAADQVWRGSAVRRAAARLVKTVGDATVIKVQRNLDTFRVGLTVRLKAIFKRNVVIE